MDAEVLKEFPNLKWFHHHKSQQWQIVYELKDNDQELQIMTPMNINGKKHSVKAEELKASRDDSEPKQIMKDLLQSIQSLYQSASTMTKSKEKLQELLEREKKALRAEKEELKKVLKQNKQKLIDRMAEKEKEIEQNEKKHQQEHVELIKKNHELMASFEKLKRELNAKKSDHVTANPDIQEMESERAMLAEQISKLEMERNLNKAQIAQLQQEIDIYRKKWYVWVEDVQTATKGGPDAESKEEEEDESKEDSNGSAAPDEQEESEKVQLNSLDILDIPMEVLDKQESQEKLESLNEFKHKYSPQSLQKYEAPKLREMVLALYLENQNLKQELRENILGVGNENAFLNIEDIVNKYNTLKTQAHENLHDRLMNELEEMCLLDDEEDDDEDDDVDVDQDDDDEFFASDTEQDQTACNLLFDLFYECKQQIDQQFDRLFTSVAKMLKIDQEKNGKQVVQNVLHSTLQTYYKQLFVPTDDDGEEQKKEHGDDIHEQNSDLFNLQAISKRVYETVIALERYKECHEALTKTRQDIVEYIVKCLEMIIIVYLNKPRLHFDYITDFQTHDKFDSEKHDRQKYDSQDKKEDLYIKYVIFPGLSIENSIDVKEKMKGGKKKKKRKRPTVEMVVVYKTHVCVS